MTPRGLLPILCVALLAAMVGARVIAAPPLLVAFVVGAITGGAATLYGAWCYMSPNFRLLVRASVQARRLR